MEVICFRCNTYEIPDVKYCERIMITEEDSSKAALMLFGHIQRFYVCNSPVKYRDSDGDVVLLENKDAYEAAINDCRNGSSDKLTLFIHGSYVKRCDDGKNVKQQIQSEVPSELERSSLKLAKLTCDCMEHNQHITQSIIGTKDEKSTDIFSVRYFCLYASCSQDPMSSEEIMRHDPSHPVIRLPNDKAFETLGINVHNLSDSSFMNSYSEIEAPESFGAELLQSAETCLLRKLNDHFGIFMAFWKARNVGTATWKNIQFDVIAISLHMSVLSCCVTPSDSLKPGETMDIIFFIKAPIESELCCAEFCLATTIGDSLVKRYLGPVLTVATSLFISLDNDLVKEYYHCNTGMKISTSLCPLPSGERNLIFISSETFSNENTNVTNAVHYFCLCSSCNQGPLSSEKFMRHDPSHPVICLPKDKTLETLGIKVYEPLDTSRLNSHDEIEIPEGSVGELLKDEDGELWRRIDNRVGIYVRHWRVRNAGTIDWKNFQIDVIAIPLHTSVLNYCITSPNPLEAGQTMDIIVWMTAPLDFSIHYAKFRLTMAMGDSPAKRYFMPLVFGLFPRSVVINTLKGNDSARNRSTYMDILGVDTIGQVETDDEC